MKFLNYKRKRFSINGSLRNPIVAIKGLIFRTVNKKKHFIVTLSTCFIIQQSVLNAQVNFVEPTLNPFGFDNLLEEYALHDISFGDIDADDDEDILLLVKSNFDYYSFYFLLNNEEIAGFPEFTNDTLLAIGIDLNNNWTAEFETFKLMDIDSDNDLDIVGLSSDYYGPYGGHCNEAFRFIENKGTNQQMDFDWEFELYPFNLHWEACKSDIQSIDYADLDFDGDLDLMVSGELYMELDPPYYYITKPSISYLENTGTNEEPFYAQQVDDAFEIEFDSSYWMPSASFVDLNDDGLFDILGNVGYYDYSVDSAYFTQYSILNVGSQQVPSFGELMINPYNLTTEILPSNQFFADELVDIDHDNDLDLILKTTCQTESNESVACTYFFENKANVLASLDYSTIKAKVYPNPADNFLNVQSHVKIKQIEIINIMGKRLLQRSFESGKKEIVIDMKDIPGGTYNITLYTNNETVSKRIIKL